MTNPIIALDVSSRKEAIAFLNLFGEKSLFLKIGMELYYSEGPDLVREIKGRGHQVFLDLKLHDIPNTVYRTMKVLARLGADIVNVHAAGGKEMMQAALRGLEDGTLQGAERPQLIAVTQLTSTTEEAMQQEQLIRYPLTDSVIHYTKLAHEAGLDGVVCSAHEAQMIRQATSPTFLRVTPGIRLANTAVGDQKRVATPETARQLGATHIVVGRPITQAQSPTAAYQQIISEWEGEKD